MKTTTKSPEIDPAQPLANARHEAFARLQAAGKCGKQAYSAVYGSKRKSVGARAVRLRARPEVRARMRHLQGKSAEAAVMGLREMLEFLTRVKRTPIGQVDAKSDVVRRFQSRAKGGKRVWMLDKRACVALAARLQGFLRKKRRSESGVRSSKSEERRSTWFDPGEEAKVLTEERRALLMAKKRAWSTGKCAAEEAGATVGGDRPGQPGTETEAGRRPAPQEAGRRPAPQRKLRDEDASEPLADARRETFARLAAAGRNGREAYQEAYGVKWRTADACASRLRARAEVSARIGHLQAEATGAAVMDLREILEFLTRVMRTPAGELAVDSEIVQGINVGRNGTEFWMPSKLGCVKLMVKLLGLGSRW